MSTYQYVSTNILTGQLLGQSIPLSVRSATCEISGAGRLDGYLPLNTQTAAATAGFMRALIPGQAMLWVLQDGYPVWHGVVLDSPHQSIKSHQYPITAYTPEAIFQGRVIQGALTYTSMDVFDIARALVVYGTTNSPMIPNAQIAGLVGLGRGSTSSGVTDTLTFGVSNTLTAGGDTYSGTYSDEQQVLDALTTLAAADGFEFTFSPQLNGTTLQSTLRLGYPALGQYDSPSPLVLMFPGNVIDYARPIMRSQAANFIIGTSAANGSGATYTSQWPNGVDSNDLDQGNLLQQIAVTWPGVGVTGQSQINQYVNTLIAKYTAGTMVPSIVLGGGQQPSLKQIGLGDAVAFAATSDLDPAGPNGEPGLQVTARITGWNLQPPDEQNEQPEQLTLTLGALVGSTGIGGVGIPQ